MDLKFHLLGVHFQTMLICKKEQFKVLILCHTIITEIKLKALTILVCSNSRENKGFICMNIVEIPNCIAD